MAANTLLTSVVTGGSNSHTTTAEEANVIPTDFVSNGVVGAITLNSGSGGTGSFCVNADASPDMGVTIKSGKAYVTATPSSQNSQVLRVRAAADYTTYVINANASGSTKYDWIYLSISATNANNPAADGSNVASFVTSRSSSNTTDNGSPPTYGLLLAIVTVANAASSITNSVITDKRFNASLGAQAGSLVVQQNGTGTDAIIQAIGTDANINLDINPKGTGRVSLNGAGGGAYAVVNTSETTTSTSYVDLATTTDTVTVTVGNSGMVLLAISVGLKNSGAGNVAVVSYAASGANTIAAADANIVSLVVGSNEVISGSTKVLTSLTAGSTVFKIKYRVDGGTGTFERRQITALPL